MAPIFTTKPVRQSAHVIILHFSRENVGCGMCFWNNVGCYCDKYSKFELSRYNMAAQDPSHGDQYFEGSCRVFSVKETDKFVFLALQVLYIAHPISMNGLQY